MPPKITYAFEKIDDHGLTMDVVMLTVDAAESLIAHQVVNRGVSDGTATRYSHVAKAGRWMLTGEPIILDTNGRMLNGQHRCHMVIRSKVPVPIVVISGVDPEAFDKMDTGKKRNAGDVLAIGGASNASDLAAALKLLVIDSYGVTSNRNIWVEHYEVRDMLGKYPGIVDSVTWVNKSKWCRRFMSRALAAYAHYMAGNIDAVKRDAFFAILEDGTGVDSNQNPAYQLREKFSFNAKQQRKLRDPDKRALVIKAFNYFAVGRRISDLQWSAGTHKFPKWQSAADIQAHAEAAAQQEDQVSAARAG